MKRLNDSAIPLGVGAVAFLVLICALTHSQRPEIRPSSRPSPTTLKFVRAAAEPPRLAARQRALAFRLAIEEIHYRESRRGADPRSGPGHIGPAGEQGEFQMTPIFIADVRHICGLRIDPHDNASCRAGIARWLAHYAPRVDARTTDELSELYRRGPSGYRRWRTRNKD